MNPMPQNKDELSPTQLARRSRNRQSKLNRAAYIRRQSFGPYWGFYNDAATFATIAISTFVFNFIERECPGILSKAGAL